jgi:hypothetical protein
VALTPDPEPSRADQLAARKDREQEVLLREVDDAVRKEQLDSVFKRYGWPIAGALVLGLAAFGGWLYWSDRQEGQLETRSEKLIAAFDKLQAGQIEQAGKDLAGLSEDGSSATAISAKLARAGIALRDNRQAEAIDLYESIARDGDAPKPHRDLATIRAVAAQFDKLDPQTVIDRLKPLATPGNPWFGSAGELVAMAYLKQGKEELAGPLFAAIAKDEDVPQTLRSRTAPARRPARLRRRGRRRQDAGRVARVRGRARRAGGGTGTMKMDRPMTLTSRSSVRLAALPLLLAGLAACSTIGIGGNGDKSATPTVGNRTPILSRIGNRGEARPTLANISIVLPPMQDNPEWAQAGGNAAKVGRPHGARRRAGARLDRQHCRRELDPPPRHGAGRRRRHAVRGRHPGHGPCIRCRNRCQALGAQGRGRQRPEELDLRRRR